MDLGAHEGIVPAGFDDRQPKTRGGRAGPVTLACAWRVTLPEGLVPSCRVEGRAVDLVANEALDSRLRGDDEVTPGDGGKEEGGLQEEAPLDPRPFSAEELRRMLPDPG